MKKYFFATLFFVSGTFCLQAQNDSGFVHKGILAGVGTIGVGDMFAHNISNVYITGNLEYYPEKKVSVRGDAYFFLNSLTQNSPLKQNSSIYFGAFYHFPTHSGFDPLIGFQPGIAFAKTTDTAYGKSDPGSAAPLFSVVTGFNFFGDKWFHIQVNVRYTVGQEYDQQSQFNLNELSFNFGLGWNIDLLSKKK
ncbi:MAG: outer membrane beta-barrel protein [Bacteroidia bacterium]